MMKICPTCNKEKDLSEFNSQGKYCKICHNEKNANWRLLNSDKNRECQISFLLKKSFSEMKICGNCKEEKLISEFSKKKTRYSSKCKTCQNEYSKNHYKNNKEVYFKKNIQTRLALSMWYNEYKKLIECIICKESEPQCLDFHHLNPNLKYKAVAQMKVNGCKIDKIKEEIDKCIVLCANCHRKLHANIFSLC